MKEVLQGWWAKRPVLSVPWRAAIGVFVTAQVLWLSLPYVTTHLFGWTSVDHQQDGRHGMAMALMKATATNPEVRQRLLAEFDDHVRSRDAHDENDPEFTTVMVVREQGQVVFKSSMLDHALPASPNQQGQEIRHEGKTWAQFCLEDPGAPVQVCFASEGPHFMVTYPPGNVQEYLNLMVIVLLAFSPLMVPAYLWAMRPVRKLCVQLAKREVSNLEPFDVRRQPRDLRPLIEAMNRWMTALREAREREQQFLAHAAHELRTPLTAIQVNAEQLRGEISPDQRPLLGPLLSGCRRMTRVVEQLMQLSRQESLSANPNQVESLDLGHVLEERLAALWVLADRKQVNLSLDSIPNVRVAVDRESLDSLVDNLVGNAIKYVQPEGRVEVSMRNQDGWAEFRVEDDGPGIPEADRERVFERFTRLGAGSEPGVGLGLAIAQSAVRAAGGHISLHTTTWGGLSVWVRLPLAKTA